MKKLILILLTAASAIAVYYVNFKSDPVNDFEKAVRNIPKNSLGGSVYWYEMNGLTGWEKVILIFGYADNLALCQYMVKIGKKDAPERDFKCTAAN
jgi:hypothetical protein